MLMIDELSKYVNRPVKLVSYTRGDIDYMIDNGVVSLEDDLQEMIAFCARVSNPSNQSNRANSNKLIQYLIKHAHWSPFEMVNACIEINTTRDIARQILRHRSFSFQEFSQRYANPNDLGFEYKDARLQDTTNRQNSLELDLSQNDQRELHDMWIEKQQDVIRAARNAYEWAISNGIAKEQARAVLPEGLTCSRMYMNGSLRSWIHFIQVRTDPTTQKEHRIVAEQCAQELAKIIPIVTDFVYKQPVGDWLGL
jgi:thymidylate synthase (FAD)